MLLQNGSLYATAGRSTYMDGGIVLYRLDPASGKQLARTVLSHHDPKTGKQLTKEGGFNMEGTTSDVLSGDVWLCSGQSNMAMQVQKCANAEEEIKAGNYPLIRDFKIRINPTMTGNSTLPNVPSGKRSAMGVAKATIMPRASASSR